MADKAKPLRLSWAPLRYFDAVGVDHTMGLFDLIDKAATLGFDGLELGWKLFANLEKRYLELVRRRFEDRGLHCSMVTPASNFTNPDGVARARELTVLCRYIDAAATLGAPCVRLTDGMDYPEVSYAIKFQNAVDSMVAAGEYAGDHNVMLAFENHWKDYFWERPEFAGPFATFVELVNAVCGPHIGVNFDCSNGLMWDYTPEHMYDVVKAHIVSVHASDRRWVTQDGGKKLVHWGVGEGIIKFGPIVQRLKADGYAGWISIEDNNPEGDSATIRSVRYFRRLWARGG